MDKNKNQECTVIPKREGLKKGGRQLFFTEGQLIKSRRHDRKTPPLSTPRVIMEPDEGTWSPGKTRAAR